MKAMLYARDGPTAVFRLADVPKPEPKRGQVLVKVHAASVNALDHRPIDGLRLEAGSRDDGLESGIKVLGADIAGRVVAVGSGVTGFGPGDAVFGVSLGSTGGFAEYACSSPDRLALMPTGLSFESAAACPTASVTALKGLRDKAGVHAGQTVLIQGASGGVGTFAVQIAKSFQAEVTAVCSARNLDLVRSLGADHVIDYRQEDFTRNGRRYDVILGVNGYRPLRDYRRALSERGRYVAIGGAMRQILEGAVLGPVLSIVGRKKFGFLGIAKVSNADLALIGDLIAAGRVTPVVDRVYPLIETVAALRYVTQEHAAGKVVLAVDPGPAPGLDQAPEPS
jgi:NADPH:quinone reductase-like Zn-dependent oxidoreductase